MKEHNNDQIPSLERRLLTTLQRKHLDELKEEAKKLEKKLEKKVFRKQDAYFTAEKSYQRFNEKYLGVVPKQEEKKKFIFPIFTTQFAQNVATFVVVASLAVAGTLSTQAIYNGGRVEIDNGKDSIEMFSIDESLSDVSYGGIEEQTRYNAIEDIEELKGKEILCLPGEIDYILHFNQYVNDYQLSIETFRFNYIIDNTPVWITMRVNDMYELKEELIIFESYEELSNLINLNIMYHKDGYSNTSFVFEGISYDIAITGMEQQLETILQLLEVKML